MRCSFGGYLAAPFDQKQNESKTEKITETVNEIEFCR